MRLRRKPNGRSESTFELNLAPMMDMMVTIIPFMLLSAVFMQLMIIDVPLPQPVAKALEQDRQMKMHEVSVAVNLAKNGVAQVIVTDEKGFSRKFSVAGVGHDFNYSLIHQKLVEVKLQYPKVFRMELNPEDGIPYKSIVGVMDAGRTLSKSDPKVFIEKAEVNLLFPDVVLANLMGN